MNRTALLIPHYNNPIGLIKSLESIDITECIDVFIIDDGSVISKIDEVNTSKAFKANGTLFFKYLNKNQGIENALNFGLKEIINQNQYKYIARLDCGDFCIGKRFQIQETFLDSNPNIKLVGANIICTDTEGKFLYNKKFPMDYKSIRNKMHVNSMISHPCAMFSIDVLNKVGLYPVDYKSAEDYAFFFNIIEEFEAANIQEYLLQYEINPNGISLSKRNQQVKNRLRIMIKHFYFGFWPIYGFLRSVLLYILPYSLIFKIKKILK